VLVNEFGAVDVDAKLITGAAGPVVEMANGCICCATMGDFARGLGMVLGEGFDIDGVLIETSGLANPAPIIEAIEASSFVRPVRVATVVAVADALNFDDNLDFAEAAFQQLMSADLVLINKCDLVTADVPAKIAANIATLNPKAESVACVHGDVASELILGLRARAGKGFLAEPVHSDEPFNSVVLTSQALLDRGAFDRWLGQMSPAVYRAKGTIHFTEARHPAVFHLVARRSSIEPAPDLGLKAGTQIVIIGRNLVAAELQIGFDRCLVR
jgi:G3E family GTPase